MNAQAKFIMGGLLAAVIGLGVALGVVLASGGDGGARTTNGIMNGNDGFAGMMQAMDTMNADSMLSYMRAVLGGAGYRCMLAHFREHRSGTATTNDPAIDGMMHEMMDGMLQHMPMDSGDMMPGQQNTHHQTPGPGMMPGG